MELEEFLDLREINTNKMNERELFYTLKGLTHEVGELNRVNLFLNVRKNKLIEENLIGGNHSETIAEIKQEMKEYSNEIGHCLADIEAINKELTHRGINAPVVI